MVRALALLALLSGPVLFGPALAGPQDVPGRVVSMNLCTDQMAMLLAAPGQLISVSDLAQDPRSSAMAEVARGWPSNTGLAEEVYLLRPDLVLAGSFTARATVSMLERLGVRVELFEPADGLDDVPAQLRRMGQILGQPARAEAVIARFEADLAAVQAVVARNPRVALYAANGYTQGDQSLAGQILLAAGLANVAAEAGYAGDGFMALEQVVMLAPEAVVTSRPYPGGSRAEEMMTHPALQALGAGRGAMSDADWVCGTPHVLRAVAAMAGLRRDLEWGAR